MIKSFFLSLLLCVSALPARAQGTDIPENYDPLEERAKIAGAYVPNYRELMRDIVFAFGDFAKETRPSFQILLDGGQDLLIRGDWENNLDDLHRAELAGASNADERFLLKLFSPEHPIPTGTPNRRFIQNFNGFLTTDSVCGKARGGLSKNARKIADEFGLSVIAVEHCRDEKQALSAQTALAKRKIPAHADTDAKAAFDTVPVDAPLFFENKENIDSVSKVRNVLVLTNTRKFTDKDTFLSALSKTNYDLLIVDPFFRSDEPLDKNDVKELQSKRMGARRLVFAVLNIGIAEDTRKYWEKGWKIGTPRWLRFQSKTNPAGAVVDYWNPAWKRIIGIYFRSILDMGYDGVVLQGLDEHKTFERIIVID